MRILVDMNLSPRWAAALTGAGWPASHWSQIGQANATDLEIVRYAAANDYIVLTHDLDFATILAFTRGGKPSVVQFRAADLSPEGLISQTIQALRHAAPDLEAGALLTIEPDRTRLRILPLRADE